MNDILAGGLSNFDPNVIVGWLAVLAVTGGALYKVGRWIFELRSDIQKALSLMVENEHRLTKHERWLVYLFGHLKISVPAENHEDDHR